MPRKVEIASGVDLMRNILLPILEIKCCEMLALAEGLLYTGHSQEKFGRNCMPNRMRKVEAEK